MGTQLPQETLVPKTYVSIVIFLETATLLVIKFWLKEVQTFTLLLKNRCLFRNKLTNIENRLVIAKRWRWEGWIASWGLVDASYRI